MQCSAGSWTNSTRILPLNEVITKAAALTEGRRSDFFNHSAVDSLSALAWIAFTGKGCGMSMPVAHVEESWQMDEFYSNKVLVELSCIRPFLNHFRLHLLSQKWGCLLFFKRLVQEMSQQIQGCHNYGPVCFSFKRRELYLRVL
ncbi:unnamed protein product [Trifolium pratense]|uniref:Uncharacterized protein n=1 Tax=Trifolium pratense TaxID=57577 RepID=A0ACB0MBZ3_TRIPR|nr:unnamed protein product [Trifolium pratense]